MVDSYYTDATNYFLKRSNAVYGIELESFSNKDDTIESGANVLNNNVELRINFDSADTLYTTGTQSYNCMFFALHDIFLVIHPETVITTVEF